MPSHQLQQRRSSSRDRLLDAAKRLFAAQGYEHTATSAIARQAGTSESQLMRYFGGKVGLLDALFEDAWEQLNQKVEEAVRDVGRPSQAAIAGILAVVSAMARDEHLATILLFEGHRLRGSHPRVRVSHGSLRFTETISHLIKTAQSRREIDPSLDARALVAAMRGASEAMLREWLLAKAAHRRAFPQRAIGHTLERLLKGCRAGV